MCTCLAKTRYDTAAESNSSSKVDCAKLALGLHDLGTADGSELVEISKVTIHEHLCVRLYSAI